MDIEIKNFYFTYGTSEQFPYQSGWTKIEAPNKKAAVAIFRAIHPDIKEGIVNCSSIYEEKAFHKTEMWTKGNFGTHEQEIITMQYFNINDFINRKSEIPWE